MRREPPQQKGAPMWMNTYGDMITLLLTLFVLLYSFSSVDAEKWQNLVTAFSGGSGVLDEAAMISEAAQSPEEFQQLYESLEEYIQENNLAEGIDLTKTENQIQIRFLVNVLFDSGRANLRADAVGILSEITAALDLYEDSLQMVRIEGHTDNVAINTIEFPSNWELSTARAVEVLRFLVENEQLSPQKLSAVGYGEYHPVADNSTEEGRMQNRRVDFVIAKAT